MDITAQSLISRNLNQTILTMAKKQQFRIQIIYRDSVSGRMVTEEYAKKNPKTTTREVRKIPI